MISSFEMQNSRTKGGLNADADSDSVRTCLCVEDLTKLLAELVSLRTRHPTNVYFDELGRRF